jgi:WD40 repeat protein
VSGFFDLATSRALELDASGRLSVRDLDSGAMKNTLPARSVPDRQLIRWDATSGWLALVDREGRWSFRAPGQERTEVTWEIHPPSIPAWLAFHPELPRMATPDASAAHPGVLLSPLPPHGEEGVRRIPLPSTPHRLEFSPSGTRLAAVCSNQPALWVLQPSLEQVQAQVRLPEAPVDFAWLPDARRVAVAGTRAIWVVDVQEESVRQFAGDVRDVSAIALNESGTLLAIGLSSGRIELWDFKAAQRIAGLGVATGAIQRIQWDPKATRLSVASAGASMPRLLGVSISRDIVHFLASAETRLPEQASAGVRRDGNRVWIRVDPKDTRELELPAPSDLKSAAISANGAWVQLRGGEDAVTEWNLPRLSERLKRFGLLR